MNTRRLVGFAVRDNTNVWVSHPSPNMRPCYQENVNLRYVFKGKDGERKARNFIRKAKADPSHGDAKEVRYCLVSIYRVPRRK